MYSWFQVQVPSRLPILTRQGQHDASNLEFPSIYWFLSKWPIVMRKLLLSSPIWIRHLVFVCLFVPLCFEIKSFFHFVFQLSKSKCSFQPLFQFVIIPDLSPWTSISQCSKHKTNSQCLSDCVNTTHCSDNSIVDDITFYLCQLSPNIRDHRFETTEKEIKSPCQTKVSHQL